MANQQATMSDLMIGTGDMSQADFDYDLENSASPGYKDFAEFMTGDYEYRYALVKMVAQSLNSDRPQLTDMVIEVDVPDIVQRGRETVSIGGVVVTFNIPYHAEPEITGSQIAGGVSAVADFSNISETGFTAHLRDATGTAVAGTLSWIAVGY